MTSITLQARRDTLRLALKLLDEDSVGEAVDVIATVFEDSDDLEARVLGRALGEAADYIPTPSPDDD